MSGFFGKLFGKKEKGNERSTSEGVLEDVLVGVLERSGLALEFELHEGESENSNRTIVVELFGDDQDLLTEKEGQLLDALQLFLKRAVQHQVEDEPVEIVVDCDGYREEANKSLVELAEKLKGIALEKGKSVYFRALPPKDRKVIHQYLAADTRVRSRSIGDGLYKKIKIYPVREGEAVSAADNL